MESIKTMEDLAEWLNKNDFMKADSMKSLCDQNEWEEGDSDGDIVAYDPKDEYDGTYYGVAITESGAKAGYWRIK